jgi:D-sedoheptulose 7-phosphate isomerase
VTAADRPGGIEGLYPSIYPGTTDLDGVLREIRRSTVEKAAEIAALRAALPHRHGAALADCAGQLAERFRAGATMYAFGNGGSSTDAQDLVQLFAHPPPPARPLPAVSLAHDVAMLTGLSNDVGYDVAFARRLAALARPHDIAVALSTSGGSVNLLRALDEANRRGMLTVGFAGYDGGRMAESHAVRHVFVVPSASVHRIQEAQTTLFHVLWELTQARVAETRPGETRRGGTRPGETPPGGWPPDAPEPRSPHGPERRPPHESPLGGPR